MIGDFRSDDEVVSTPESADHCRGADFTELLLSRPFCFELKANMIEIVSILLVLFENCNVMFPNLFYSVVLRVW